MGRKIWNYNNFDNIDVDKLAKDANISKLMAKVFASRNISDSEYIKDFLKPSIDKLHNPFLMDGMENAVKRIADAVSGREGILIFGDYDVDGIASTSILYNFLKGLDSNVDYYIPDRMTEGYGLTMSSVEKIHELAGKWKSMDGIELKLIITVDCGITSVQEIESIRNLGIDVIITDHHECKDILPEAYSVINPHKPECSYPFKELAGAGVTLKLVHALGIRLGNSDAYKDYIDLAALATVADVVPLLGENRIIVSNGLKAIEATKNIGLGALIRVSGFGGKPLTASNLAFGLAPRINAAGRVGSADRGVRLFTVNDLAVAEALAKELDKENVSRQNTECNILEEALSFIENQLDADKEKVLVVSGTGWHKGVIGIVASRITEKYNRPCIVISVEDGIGKGSGRSLKCFNMFAALSYCDNMLINFGGHEMAAGLTLAADKIDSFRFLINEYADSVLKAEHLIPALKVDAFLEKGDITLSNIEALKELEPFGAGNPSPVFGYRRISLVNLRTLSDGKHLKLRMSDEELNVDAVGFNMGKMAEDFSAGDTVDVASLLEVNRWNGKENIQLVLKDIAAV